MLNEAEKFRKALQYAVNVGVNLTRFQDAKTIDHLLSQFGPGSILSVHLGRKALALYIEAK